MEQKVSVERPLSSSSDGTLDFRSASAFRVLFEIAERGDVSLNEIAEIAEKSAVERILRDRFDDELSIDPDGRIRLNNSAHPFVVIAGNRYIETSHELYDQGESLVEVDQHEAALESFAATVSILDSVVASYETIGVSHDEVDDFHERARRKHDAAAKVQTCASIAGHLQEIERLRYDATAVGEQTETIKANRGALDRIATATDTAVEYNESRLHDDSSILSTTELDQLRTEIEQDLADLQADSDVPERDSSSRDGRDGGEDTTNRDQEPIQNDPTPEALLREIEHLTGTLGKVPSSSEMKEHGGYAPHQYYNEFGGWAEAVAQADVDIRSDLREDLRDVARDLEKPPTTTDIDRHGRYDSHRYRNFVETWDEALDDAGVSSIGREELIEELHRLDAEIGKIPAANVMRDEGRYAANQYFENFGSWDEALATAGIDIETRLIEELERVATEVGETPNTSQMNDLGAYSASYYSNHFGSWSEALEAAGVDTQSSGPESTGSINPPDGLEPSAYETSWESIPDNSRLSEQLVALVTGIKEPHGDRKSVILEVTDRTGESFKMDVWKKHDISTEWKEYQWYALSETRGTAWEKDGELRKRLSSTADLEVVEVESDAVPDGNQDAGGSGSSENSSIEPGSATGDVPAASNGSGTEEDNHDSTKRNEADAGIFDDIISDFDDL